MGNLIFAHCLQLMTLLGDYEGEGETRKDELFRAAIALGRGGGGPIDIRRLLLCWVSFVHVLC